MSRSLAGIKQILLCNAGTLETTPVNPLALGFRAETNLEIARHEEIKDYRNRSLPNMLNFKFSGESYQSNMLMLVLMINWLNLNADVQVVTAKQSTASGSDDVFKFVGDNKLGIGFEYLINAKKRSLKANFEVAMELDRAKTLIDSADSEATITVAGITNDGASSSLYRSPYSLGLESPQGSSVFGIPDFIERELKITTEGTRSKYNDEIISYLMFSLSVTGMEATIAKIIAEMDKDFDANILWKEKNQGSFYDAFDFAPGVLTKKDEITIGDKERKIKLIYEGKVPLFDVAFEYGDGKGGDVGDTDGANGGTMKIGY